MIEAIQGFAARHRAPHYIIANAIDARAGCPVRAARTARQHLGRRRCTWFLGTRSGEHFMEKVGHVAHTGGADRMAEGDPGSVEIALV